MKSLIVLIALTLLTSVANGDVQLPDVIGSSMVLQQHQRVPIWGTAGPGESVTVAFGGQTRTVVAGPSGKWRVDLGKFAPSFVPRVMTVTGRNEIELRDILVGEVWLVAGQSNMQRLLRETENGVQAQALADHPNLRLFNVSREVAFKRKAGKIGEWAACTPASVSEFSAAGYYFGVELERGSLKVPIGLINSSYGGSQAEAWTPVEYLNASPDLRPTVERTKIWDAERDSVRADYADAIARWRVAADKQKNAGAVPSPSPGVPDALRDYRIASSIYDRMIEPLMPFAIKGAAWYQGESNEARAEQYNLLLATMIRAWRERWGQPRLPFGIVQLPNFRSVKAEPEEAAWSFVREAQRLNASRDRNCGLIVTIDIGEAGDVHPKNKLDVGKRLARWALNDVYGQKLTSAPVVKSVEIKGATIVITFSSVGTGLRVSSGDRPAEFAIAGVDKKWIWAEAKIVGKNKVEVSSNKVPAPLAVRYAFNSNPKNANLTNDSGLPASPFRTDNWPDPTAGRW